MTPEQRDRHDLGDPVRLAPENAHKACPACGDEERGYTYDMTETHAQVGVWGESSIAGDSGKNVRIGLVHCRSCDCRFTLANLSRQGLAE